MNESKQQLTDAQPALAGTKDERLLRLPNQEQLAHNDESWSGPFYFVQAADTQFGLIDSLLKNLPEPGWDDEMRLSEQLIEHCNRLRPRPRFLVVCGDLVDALPGTSLRREQVRDFKRIFAKLDPTIPLICVCGNHDIGNEPTEAGLLEYRRDFGQDYFYFVTGGVLFIVINSQFYQHRAHMENYAAEQDAWLIEILAKCKQYKYSIVFQHIPWFLGEPNEENDYFNVDKSIRLEWLERFNSAGVSKIMCGHYHRNGGGWFKGQMELVVTSAVGAQLGNDKSGTRVVRILEDGIEHCYYAIEDIPLSVSL